MPEDAHALLSGSSVQKASAAAPLAVLSVACVAGLSGWAASPGGLGATDPDRATVSATFVTAPPVSLTPTSAFLTDGVRGRGTVAITQAPTQAPTDRVGSASGATPGAAHDLLAAAPAVQPDHDEDAALTPSGGSTEPTTGPTAEPTGEPDDSATSGTTVTTDEPLTEEEATEQCLDQGISVLDVVALADCVADLLE